MKSAPVRCDDDYWMKLALQEALKSAKRGEVPVGAVAVYRNRRIASAHNLTLQLQDPTAHAEILCLRKAARRLKNYRLTDIILYVTMEPCAMCAGALIWARARRVVFGCADKNSGACGSILDLSQVPALNHRFEVVGGVRENECRKILQKFFRQRR